MPEPIDLHNRIDLTNIPFSERGSRILLFRRENMLYVRLTERWVKQESAYGHYRQRVPIIDNFTFLDSNGEPLEFTVDSNPHSVDIFVGDLKFSWMFLDTEALLVRLPAGAYGFSMASQYNARPRPAEVLVAGSEARLIRRRETYEELWGR